MRSRLRFPRCKQYSIVYVDQSDLSSTFVLVNSHHTVAQMGYPTFLDVPPEVRRYIYEYIFAGLELDVSDIKDLKDQRYVHEQVYADDTGPSRKFSPGAILEPYFAATSILLVNRHIRSEALPLFEENLTLILSSIRELQLAEKFFHNAHLVRLRIMALMPIPPDTIRRHLPQVKRITYEAANLYPWEDLESLVCDTWEDLFRILKGQKDADLLDDYRKWMSHAMASPGAFKMFADSDPPACEVVFEFANLYITWRDCESKSLAFLYVSFAATLPINFTSDGVPEIRFRPIQV